MKPDITLALGGRTGAGKTTVGRRLADALGVPLVSFGDFVRSEAEIRGLGHEREILQCLGQNLIGTLGWTAFCERALAAAGVELPHVSVIEGVRHVEVIQALRSLYTPLRVRFVWLDVTDEDRAARLRARGDDPQLLASWERHETEHQVLGALPAAANLRVASDDGAVQRIVDWIGHGNPARDSP